MPEIVAVVFYATERDAAQPVDFQYVLGTVWGGADVDVAFFADADAVTGGIEGGVFEVRVEGEVVEAAVGEAVAIVWGFKGSASRVGSCTGRMWGERVGGVTFGIFRPGDEVYFCEGGYAFVDTASTSQMRKLYDERCGDDFVVLATYFHLNWSESAGFLHDWGNYIYHGTYCCEDTPVVRGKIAESFGIELHCKSCTFAVEYLS